MAAPSAHAQKLHLIPSKEKFEGLSGTTFPKQVVLRHDGGEIVLHAAGSGVRRQLMFKVYEAAAYSDRLDKFVSPYEAFTSGDAVAHMRLHFLRTMTGAKVREAVEDGIDRVAGSEKVADQTAAFLEYLADGVRKGQKIELTWVPTVGLFSEIGGKAKPMIPGDEFAQTVLMVWFGSDPVSSELKHDMVRFAK